jgi:hypothetical protein
MSAARRWSSEKPIKMKRKIRSGLTEPELYEGLLEELYEKFVQREQETVPVSHRNRLLLTFFDFFDFGELSKEPSL